MKHLSAGQLKNGLEGLFQDLYSPAAFAERLLGNLSRFEEVRFRPESMRLSYAAIFARLARYYGRKGRVARRFFWGCLWKAFRHSPRVVGQVVIYLGMYMHFVELHRAATGWDVWSESSPREVPTCALADRVDVAIPA